MFRSQFMKKARISSYRLRNLKRRNMDGDQFINRSKRY